MGLAWLDRESLRDSSGNLVPLGILLFFMLWFGLRDPWGWTLYTGLVVYGVLGSLLISLLVVTYGFARKFQEVDVEQ